MGFRWGWGYDDSCWIGLNRGVELDWWRERERKLAEDIGFIAIIGVCCMCESFGNGELL